MHVLMMLYCQILEQWARVQPIQKISQKYLLVRDQSCEQPKKFFVYSDFKNRQYYYIFDDKLDQFGD